MGLDGRSGALFYAFCSILAFFSEVLSVFVSSKDCWRFDVSGRKSVVLENPSVKEAAEFVGEAVSERKVVVVVGNCWVDYRGRASSRLEAGERIVVVKEDGSVLVHRPVGYEPVNWQPAGCLF